MNRSLFCFACGDSIAAQSEKCKKCNIDVAPFRELLELVKVSDTYSRSVTYKKSKIIIKEKRIAKDGIKFEKALSDYFMSTGKFFVFLLVILGSVFLALNFFVANKSFSIEDNRQPIVAKPNPSIFDEEAAQFFVPGDALITLTQVWGISLNDSNGPRILRDVIDDIYLYLSDASPGNNTKENMRIAFQPGNSLHAFFTRLVDNERAYNAIARRLINLSI